VAFFGALALGAFAFFVARLAVDFKTLFAFLTAFFAAFFAAIKLDNW
jgi:hypothetical protein